MHKVSEVVRTFTDRYPLIGPAIWMLSIQYFLIQIVVAASWPGRYSWSRNVISDLGNTACGAYGGTYVCSPLHSLMNASFIMLGTTMALGSLLIYQEFRRSRASLVGFSFTALAGVGTILVGVFPENTIMLLHAFGAFLPFFAGNVGLFILGTALDIPKWLRLYTLGSAVIALLALPLFALHTYLGLGIGGMERLVAYPQTMWLIVFGIYISSNHIRRSAD